MHNGIIYDAMIDTGAEATAIDRRVAEAINAQQVSKGIVHAMDGTFEAQAVRIQVIFPEPNIVFSTRAAVLNFEKAGHTFDLILGRSFLQHCRLSLDGPDARFSLEWLR